jgi:hypothetical protein
MDSEEPHCQAWLASSILFPVQAMDAAVRSFKWWTAGLHITCRPENRPARRRMCHRQVSRSGGDKILNDTRPLRREKTCSERKKSKREICCGSHGRASYLIAKLQPIKGQGRTDRGKRTKRSQGREIASSSSRRHQEEQIPSRNRGTKEPAERRLHPGTNEGGTHPGAKSIFTHTSDEASGIRFFHPDGVNRPSRAPGSSFLSGSGPSSIRRAQANPGLPGHARGLRTKETRAKRREKFPRVV